MKKDDKKGTKSTTESTTNVGNVQPPVTTTALTIIPKCETLEEVNKKLEAKIEELKKELTKIPQTLEGRIEYIQLKQTKIKQLEKLKASSENLAEHIESLDNSIKDDDFKCDSYILSVNDKSSYKEAPVFTMNNPVIIREVIVFVLNRIEEKMETLKMEISA